MPIPDYQTLMLPLLRLLENGEEHTHAEVRDALANYYSLTPEERSQLIPSGRQFLFDNRLHWARSYLKNARLVESTGRAKFRITDRGCEVLGFNPPKITNHFLKQFPEFVQFTTSVTDIVPAATPESSKSAIASSENADTPEERLDASYQSLRTALAQELLDRIGQSSPVFFEQLVVDLLVAMGYGGSRQDAGQAVGGTGDGGIDGIIKEDRLGLDAIYIQAKRWSSSVGRPTVQQFAGSLMGRKARKGVLISTSEFTQDARDYTAQIDLKIVLIGGIELARLMIDHGVGVTEAAVYRVFRVNADYFGDE